MRGPLILLASAAALLTGGLVLALETASSPAPPSAHGAATSRATAVADRSARIEPSVPDGAGDAPRARPIAEPSVAQPHATVRSPVAIAERRDALRAQIRRSGAASAQLARRAADVIPDWQRAAPAELAQRVQFAPLECHANGCFVEATYADQLAFELVDDSLVASAAFQSYPGWRHRAGPIEEASGTITATWFFMPAEAPGSPRQPTP